MECLQLETLSDFVGGYVGLGDQNMPQGILERFRGIWARGEKRNGGREERAPADRRHLLQQGLPDRHWAGHSSEDAGARDSNQRQHSCRGVIGNVLAHLRTFSIK